MADPFNPYAIPPVSGNDPSAGNPYSVTPEIPSWYLDMAKTAVPSLIRGGTGALTGVPTLANLAAQGVDFGAGKAAEAGWISPETATTTKGWAKTAQDYTEPFTYGRNMQRIENVTGKLYEPQTTAGKVFGTTLEIAPGMFVGGATGLAPKLSAPATRMVRSLGGGVGATTGEALGEKLTEANLLPEGAAPILKALGGVGGVMAGPRMVTPLPATAEHAAATKALGEAGIKNLSPAEKTGRDWLYRFESNLNENKYKSDATGKFTNAAAQQAAMPANTTRLTPGAFAGGDQALGAYKQAVHGAEIKGTDFTDLQKSFKQVGADAKKALHNDPGMVSVENRIAQLAGSPGAMSMPGPRYAQMRDELQGAIKNSRGAEKDAYVRLKDTLDATMAKQLPPEMAGMHKSAANLGVLKNTPLDVNQQLTPKDLREAITDQWGQAAYNQGRGMAPLTQAGETVFKHPAAKTGPSPVTEALVGGLGAMAAPAGTGEVGKLAGYFASKGLAAPIQWAGKKAIAEPLYSGVGPIGGVGSILGNQLLKSHGAPADMEMLVRALRGPEALPQLTYQPPQ